MRNWILLVGVLVATNAWAEGGELYGEFAPGLEIAQMAYARADLTGAKDARGLMPRIGLAFRYGLADSWQLGLGGSIAWDGSVAFNDTVVDGRSGRLYASYRDISTPVSLSFMWSRGFDWSGLFSIYGGPSFVQWKEAGLVNPEQKDSEGNLARYPVKLRNSKEMVWFVGGAATGEWRPLDWLALRIGPYFELRNVGASAKTIHVGVAVQPAVIGGVGPSF